MTEKKKMFIGLGAAAAVLLGILGALLLTGGEQAPEKQEETAPEEKTVELAAFDSASVEEITISNDSGTYTIGRDADGNLLVQELSDYSQDEEMLETVVRNLSSLSGPLVYEKGFDEKQFGLKDPSASIEITSGGREVRLRLGDYNEGASCWYVEEEDSGVLCSIPKGKGDWMKRSQFYYLDRTLIQTFDAKTESMTDRLSEIRVERPDLSEPLEIVASEEPAQAYTSAYLLTSPIRVKTSLKVMNEEIGSLFGFTAAEALDFYRESDDGRYGFDEPAMVMTVVHDGTEEQFTVGHEDGNGSRYLKSSERDFVYLVEESRLSFLNVTADDLFYEMAVLPEIDDVTGVELQIGNEEYLFALEHTGEELKVSLGDTQVEEKLFRTFYSFLLEVDIEHIRTEEPSGESILKITYQYKDGSQDVVEAFAMEDSRRMSISVNGEPRFKGRTAYLEKLRTELDHLLNGEAIDTNW